MVARLPFEIQPQPDDATCGPTCLHAVYRYFGDCLDLHQVISEVPTLPDGGTLAVLLGCHALRRGYRVTIYTYNLQVFDPTWFADPRTDLRAKLSAQLALKGDRRLAAASRGYMELLGLGGTLRLEDLTSRLIRRYLTAGVPILCGLSSTYLYRAAREHGPGDEADDVRGDPTGHFVVLCGYDRAERTVLVADPLHENPFDKSLIYPVCIDRVLCAILLGVLTYDANLLIVQPRRGEER
jgi:hypothetical protein